MLVFDWDFRHEFSNAVSCSARGPDHKSLNRNIGKHPMDYRVTRSYNSHHARLENAVHSIDNVVEFTFKDVEDLDRFMEVSGPALTPNGKDDLADLYFGTAEVSLLNQHFDREAVSSLQQPRTRGAWFVTAYLGLSSEGHQEAR